MIRFPEGKARRIARGASVVAALWIAPASAAADSTADQAQADTLFTEGRRLLGAGRFAEACPKFAESQRLDPALGTLLNLGDCYEKTGRTASAWAVFQSAVAEAQRTHDARRGAVAAERAAALEGRLGRLTIAVPRLSQAPGLVVKRDGVPLDRDAWGAATPLDPGWHAIEATAPGKRRWTLPVTIDAGHATTITVPPLDDPGAVSAATEPGSQGHTQRVVGAIFVGTGVAAIAAGAVFTGLAAAKDHASASRCHGNRCDARGVALREDALGNATAATVATVAGLVAASGGTALWWTAKAGAKRPFSTGIHAIPAIGAGQIGLTLGGAF
jgi:hypothetical protein